MLTQADLPAGYVLTVSTPAHVVILDSHDDSLGIDGTLDGGVLKFEIRTVSPITGARSLVRGTVLFDFMMQHFGTNTVVLMGLWHEGTNLADFNRSMKAHGDPERSARETWTGRQAARHGYSEVHFAQKLGSVYGYGLVEVEFRQPTGAP